MSCEYVDTRFMLFSTVWDLPWISQCRNGSEWPDVAKGKSIKGCSPIWNTGLVHDIHDFPSSLAAKQAVNRQVGQNAPGNYSYHSGLCNVLGVVQGRTIQGRKGAQDCEAVPTDTELFAGLTAPDARGDSPAGHSHPVLWESR